MSFTDRIALQLYSVKEETGKVFLETLGRVAAIGYSNVEIAGFFNTPAVKLN